MTDVVLVGSQHGKNKQTKSYSVNKYEFENAQELAIQYRDRIERELSHYANVLQLNVDEQ